MYYATARLDHINASLRNKKLGYVSHINPSNWVEYSGQLMINAISGSIVIVQSDSENDIPNYLYTTQSDNIPTKLNETCFGWMVVDYQVTGKLLVLSLLRDVFFKDVQLFAPDLKIPCVRGEFDSNDVPVFYRDLIIPSLKKSTAKLDDILNSGQWALGGVSYIVYHSKASHGFPLKYGNIDVNNIYYSLANNISDYNRLINKIGSTNIYASTLFPLNPYSQSINTKNVTIDTLAPTVDQYTNLANCGHSLANAMAQFKTCYDLIAGKQLPAEDLLNSSNMMNLSKIDVENVQQILQFEFFDKILENLPCQTSINSMDTCISALQNAAGRLNNVTAIPQLNSVQIANIIARINDGIGYLNSIKDYYSNGLDNWTATVYEVAGGAVLIDLSSEILGGTNIFSDGSDYIEITFFGQKFFIKANVVNNNFNNRLGDGYQLSIIPNMIGFIIQLNEITSSKNNVIDQKQFNIQLPITTTNTQSFWANNINAKQASQVQIAAIDQQTKWQLNDTNFGYQQDQAKARTANIATSIGLAVAGVGLIATGAGAAAGVAMIAGAAANQIKTDQANNARAQKYLYDLDKLEDNANYQKAKIQTEFAQNQAQIASVPPTIKNLDDCLGTLAINQQDGNLIIVDVYNQYEPTVQDREQYYQLYNYYLGGKMTMLATAMKGFWQFKNVQRYITNSYMPSSVIQLIIIELEQGVRFI